MKIYCCQLDVAWEDKRTNFKRVAHLLARHEVAPGSLVILPEMFASGHTLNAAAIAEETGGPTESFLAGLAQEKGVYLLGGLARINSHGRFQNEAICLCPSGQRILSYAKLHVPAPEGKSQPYTPGTRLALFHWREIKVAVFISHDLRFPEIFRMAVQRGASVLVVIANWPGKCQSHWTTLLRARAIENQAYVIGVNRCGMDSQQDCFGGSLVVDPQGARVAEAGGGEALLSVDLEIQALNQLRLNFPVLRDMRTRLVLEPPASRPTRRHPPLPSGPQKTSGRIAAHLMVEKVLPLPTTDDLLGEPNALPPLTTLDISGLRGAPHPFQPQNNSPIL